MISVDDVTEHMDAALTRVTKLLGYEYSDNRNAIGEFKTFTCSQHGTADLIPLANVDAFVSKIRHWLLTNPTPYPTILSFCIEGPETHSQNCFLNRNAHPHLVWNVCFEFVE